MSGNEKKCPNCGCNKFLHDVVDVMGDNREEHFSRTVEVCSDCRIIVNYLDSNRG